MKISTIDTGTFKLDGGAMFGVVPKRLWNKLNPADENNLCTWAMRCLLIQTGDRNILVDTGIGQKQDEKFKSYFEPVDQDNLFKSLLALDLSPADISDVILTHLHFDHVGGAVSREGGQLVPTFPNATYWTTQTHLTWALNPNAKEAASFLKENIQPLLDAKVIKFLSEESGSAFTEGIKIFHADGHTRNMTYLNIENGSKTLIYCADLIPSSYHVSLPYIMSYDISPMKTLEEKKALLKEAVEKNYVLIFEHDPIFEAGIVEINDKGRFVLKHKGTLMELLSI